jgi:hypothetical protein
MRQLARLTHQDGALAAVRNARKAHQWCSAYQKLAHPLGLLGYQRKWWLLVGSWLNLQLCLQCTTAEVQTQGVRRLLKGASGSILMRRISQVVVWGEV